MNTEFPSPEVALANSFHNAVKDQPWRSRVLIGYLPYWKWRSRRFEWEPSPALSDEWAARGEIG